MSELAPIQHEVYTAFCSPALMNKTTTEAFTHLHKQFPQIKHCVKRKTGEHELQFVFIFHGDVNDLIVVRKTTPMPTLSNFNNEEVVLKGDALKEVLEKVGRPKDGNYFKHWTDRP